MCTTSFHPPSEKKNYFASVRGLASNRSERPCLAARTLLLADFAIGLPPQCCDLCQISWGFHQYDIIKFHRQLQEQLCIRVLAATAGGGAQLRGRGGRVRPQLGQPRRFSRATKKVLACRHMRSLQLLYTVGGDLASPRTEAK